MSAIVVDGLVKNYRKGARAVNGLSFSIEEGQCYGLLGPNGAGKTTVIKCLLGLLNVTGGRVEILGRNPTTIDSRRNIGFCPEVPAFPNFLTAPEVMKFHGALAGLPADQVASEAAALLETAELTDKKKRVKAFSKGMVRRLALAQSLLGGPRVLLLDEPTADLDPLGRRDVRRILENRPKNVTVLLNSHLLSEVERICDRVIIMHQGAALAEGNVDELVPQGSDLETVFIDLVEKAKGL